MIPAGIYAAVVVPVETSSGPLSIQFGPPTKNSPFTAVLSFEIINGPCAGQRLTSFLYFGNKPSPGTGKTSMDRSLEQLRICGFSGEDLDKFADQRPDIEVSLTVEHETYTNQAGELKTNAKVKWINSPMRGFVMKEPLDKGEVRRFSAQLKGALKRLPPVAGRKAERQAPTSEASADDPGEPEDRGDDPFQSPPASTPRNNPNTNDDIPF